MNELTTITYMQDRADQVSHGRPYVVDSADKVVGVAPDGPHNWGRWGADDEIGTLNLLTPERRQHAASLVQDGGVFSLGLPLGRDAPVAGTRSAAVVSLTSSAADAVLGHRMLHGVQSTDEIISMPLQTATHVDGLAHIALQDTLYNGFWAGSVSSRLGATRLGGQRMAEGIVGRGVLVDIARHASFDPVSGIVDTDLLESTLALQGVDVLPGDLLLVRTGWLGHFLANPNNRRRSSGLAPSVASWLAEHDIAMVACDNRTVEAIPNPEGEALLPLHVTALRGLGMPLGELFQLDDLARHCARTGRYVGLLTLGTLPILGTVGSPATPLFLT
jgi:kynurenine formamidase